MFSIFASPTSSDYYATREDLAVCGRFGLPADRLWRFEFVVRKGEDPMAMAGPEARAKSCILTSLMQEVGMGCPRPFNIPQTASERCGPGHSASLRGVATNGRWVG